MVSAFCLCFSFITLPYFTFFTFSPLVAILSSIGSFECKFIMATMHVENNHNDEIVTENEEEEDHVSGTDDEQA